MNIDVVIIGLNSERTLRSCLESVTSCHDPGGAVKIFYVDSGSRDRSLQMAKSYRDQGVVVLESEAEDASRSAARNLGWQSGQAPLVQFLDADAILDPDWLARAAAEMTAGTGALHGHRRERHPEKSIFNWLAGQAENAAAGDGETLGGDALIRRELLAETGGYDETLVEGECRDFSQRARKACWRVARMDVPMTTHDSSLHGLEQAWERSFRAGYGYAEAAARRGGFDRECGRVLIRGGAGLGLILTGLLGGALQPAWLLFVLLGLALILCPLLARSADLSLSPRQARIYAWHRSLVVIPECCGIARYVAGRIFKRPLRRFRLHGTPARSSLLAAAAGASVLLVS